MKLALIIGIDYYPKINPLFGCVNDAYGVKGMLERNDGGSVNFECKLVTASSSSDALTRKQLKDAIEDLFNRKTDVSLLYFAGHGHLESSGGYILGSDADTGDDGVPLIDIMTYAAKSPSANKIVILDSCHSGIAGASSIHTDSTTLNEGMTILTASDKDQYASEKNGSGLFTSLLIDALSGSAANLLGEVTPGSVYAHIDQSLGGFQQRPLFKTNVRNFVCLRNTAPAISLEHLHLLTKYFPSPGFEYKLDPTYEPEVIGRSEGMPPPIEENTKIFGVLQKYNRLNLLKPNGAPHMWHAAMQSKSCKLTALGEHYRRLVEDGRI